MRVVFLALGAAVTGGALLVACNSVLGIDKASPEPAAATFVATDDCAAYCADINLSCPPSGSNQEYLSQDVCTKMCGDRTTAENFDELQLNHSVDISATSMMPTTDTLYCRVWHSYAALSEPDVHCRHAGPLGGDKCGTSSCADFCAMAVDFCKDAYKSLDDCMNACQPDAGGYPGFPYSTTAPDLQDTGNTLNCRIYHLENFLYTGNALHCTHVTQKSTSDTCGAATAE